MRQPAPALEVAHDAAHEETGDVHDVLVRELHRRLEAGRGERALARVDVVEHQRVEVQVQGAAESLSEDHRARTARGSASCLGALAHPAEDGPDEDAAHRAAKGGVEGQQASDAVGEGEHPLAHADFGQHRVHEGHRRIRYPPAGARGTEAATFARESEQLVLAALRTAQARESAVEDAAVEDAAGERAHELAGHEAGQAGAVLLARASQEGREVLAQHLVQRAALASAAPGPCWLVLRVHPGQGLLGAPFGCR